jgi:hypothetical protein
MVIKPQITSKDPPEADELMRKRSPPEADEPYISKKLGCTFKN